MNLPRCTIPLPKSKDSKLPPSGVQTLPGGRALRSPFPVRNPSQDRDVPLEAREPLEDVHPTTLPPHNHPTWYRSAKGNKDDSSHRVLEANGTAEMGGKVTNDGCEHADDEDGDNKAGPAVAVLSGGHAGKQHLPEDSQEVHHIVKAGRQALLTGLIFVLITRCKQCGRERLEHVKITGVGCSLCLATPAQGSRDAALLEQGGMVLAMAVGSGHTRYLNDG